MTVNKEPANAAEQVAPMVGAVTAQKLGAAEVSKAMPAPDRVMMIPAWGPAVMAPVGVNEKVAVVDVALTVDASVIARPLMPEIPRRAGTETPTLTVSTEVDTVRPLGLTPTMGPVVNSPAAKFIFVTPTGTA